PKRRYASAQALADELGYFLNNEPIQDRPPSQVYRFQKLVRRNRLAFAAGATVTLALVLGIVASTWQAVRRARLLDAAASGDARTGIARGERSHHESSKSLRGRHEPRRAGARRQNLPQARELLEKHRPSPGNPSDSPLRADLRGWEWRYLMGQCRSDEIATL